MSFYRYHLFFCTNFRASGEQCCGQGPGEELRAFAQKYLRDHDLAGPGGVRTSTTGCMGRCAEGPVLVVYPEGVWYTYETKEDMEEILHKHIEQGQIVKHLLL